MTVVADVVARFRADFSDLNTGVDATADKLGGLHDSAGGLSAHFAGPGSAGEGAQDLAEKLSAGTEAVDELGRAGEKTGAALKQMIIPIVGAAGLGGLLDMAKNTTMELQTLGVQFNATFGGSGQSDLKQAISDANDLGVSVQSAATAYQSFGQSTKGTTQPMQADMKDFGDIAAGTGETIDQVASSIGNYYQLIQRVGGSGGQASRYATSLLTSHIIDPETYNQLRLMANQGANPQQLLNTVVDNGESQYKGAGKSQADTLGGEMQTFKNQFSDSTAGAFAPILQQLQAGLKDLNSSMQGSGFHQITQDASQFFEVIAKGVDVLAPLAKSLLEITGGLLSMAQQLSVLKPLAEALVAAFILFKGVGLATTLAQDIAGMVGLSSAEVGLTAATTASTAALTSEGVAVPASMDLRAVNEAAPGALAADQAPSALSRFGGAAGAAGLAGAVGSSMVGSAVGGTAGSGISDIGGGAAIGTMIDPGIGTIVGAAAGGLVFAFQQAQQAAAAFAAGVKGDVSNFDKDHPVGSTVSSINSAYDAAHPKTDLNSPGAWKNFQTVLKGDTSGQENPKGFNAALQESAAQKQEASETAGARYNMTANLDAIVKQTGMSLQQAGQFAQQNNINLSSAYGSQAEAIKTATTSINQLGGAAQFSAEQISSAYNNIAAQVSGQYGEATANPTKLIDTAGKSEGLSSAQAQSQFFTYAKDAGIDLGTMGITPANLAQGANATTALPGGGSTPDITPQEAQLKNQMLSVTLQYTQALQGEQEAAFAVGQAEFSLGQAEFSLGQAQFALTQAAFSLTQAYFAQSQAAFSLSQANFELSRAQVANTTALVTQQDALEGVSSALDSGYLPANINVAAALSQVTSLTTQQISAIQAEVSSYNSLEQAMYGSINGAASLYDQYTSLNGIVQQLQSQTQQYQQLLAEPLAGSEQYSQAQETYKVQEAAIQQSIDQLEQQRVPTDDPRVKTLQAQLALLQSQADLSTQINTQGVGQQQFNIQQAQLGPQQSYATQLGAAQAMGQLNQQLLAAQQALDPVNTAYIALNTQLTIASQKNTAFTSALQSQAGADQGAITAANGVVTANNSVTTAANGVVTANNGVVTAANGVRTAQNGVATAQNGVATASFGVTTAQWGYQASLISVQEATNTLASQYLANLATALQELQGYITNVGIAAQNASNNFISGFNQLIGAENALNPGLTPAETGGPLGEAMLGSTTGAGSILHPAKATGGYVPGSGGVPTMLHGGEFVLSNPMLAQLNGSGVAGGLGGGSNGGINVSDGAVQVSIAVQGGGGGMDQSTMEAIQTELQGVVEDAFNQILQKWNAQG